MGKKMSNAPVFFTIAQVRFNPVVRLPEFVAAIQDGLRRMGYPDFNESPALSAPVIDAGGTLLKAPSQILHYSFLNTEGNENIGLNRDSISYQVVEYETFEEFKSQFQKILELVNRKVDGLMYVDRIGLRYLDAIRPGPGETVGQYLVPAALGLYGTLGEPLHHAYSEIQVEGDEASLICRTLIHNSKVLLPPDLQQAGLSLPKTFLEYEGLHATLDTDAYYQRRVKFDLTRIDERLSLLHDRVTGAFKSSVTPFALAKWE